jgi:hypothetical protein
VEAGPEPAQRDPAWLFPGRGAGASAAGGLVGSQEFGRAEDQDAQADRDSFTWPSSLLVGVPLSKRKCKKDQRAKMMLLPVACTVFRRIPDSIVND